ncbi:MAG: zinc ribbon domain-containing protein [Prevotella sp.]|nr:zinc ribbon domain-containing protein [Prevotella sp.]
MRYGRLISVLMLLVMVLTGCYNRRQQRVVYADLNERQLDSLAFLRNHHFTQNFNFIVTADSLPLLEQQPEEKVNSMPTDSFQIYKGQRLVVADIRILPTDTVDSVWIQVAHNQDTFGWTHESDLLDSADPDDPISRFITVFSNTHLIIFLIIVTLIAGVYFLRKLSKADGKIVHFNDIDTFYPTLLTILVSASATLYASIQNFDPEMWREFYFHPSLNPFVQPRLMGLFIGSVWLMLIIALASVEDVVRQLGFDEAVLYLSGLLAICAIDYVVFSVTTLWYVGYVLLVAYVVFALWRYWRYARMPMICGKCGGKIPGKGRCPHCGAMNIS